MVGRWLLSSQRIHAQHVGQDILGVLQPLGHFDVVALQSLVQGHRRPLSFLVDISDESALRVQQDFSVVLEVNLHDLVAKPEHDCVLSSHPLLDVYGPREGLKPEGCVLLPLNQLLLFLGVEGLLQVALEVLEESHFLLEFLRETDERILLHDVLLLADGNLLSLVVEEL